VIHKLEDRGRADPERPEFSSQNEVLEVPRVTSDVSSFVRQREWLEQRERYYRDALDALPVAVYLTDPAGKITYYNQSAAQLAGQQPILGSAEWCVTWRLYAQDGAPIPHSECPMAIALRERRPVRGQELIAERPDGSRVAVLPFPTPLFSVDGALIGAVNMLMDISDWKREEGQSKRLTEFLEQEVQQRTQALAETITKLKESERTFRLLVEGVTDYAIYMLDTTGRVANWNAGASRIKGYERAEIVGQHFSKFYTDEARVAGLPERALSTAVERGRFEAEDWRVRKDGSRFWANVVIDAIHDEDGTLVGFAKVTRDLTERRAMDEKLRQVQRIESVGQLTAGIAHDFNNLLTVILGNLELLSLLQAEPDSEKRTARVARAITLATEGGRRAAGLTRRLLAFSRQQALEPEPLEVDRRVRHVVDLLERTLGESIRIQVNLAPDLGLVFADPAEFESMLLNLAVNGRDAMPDGGRLVIEGVNLDAAVGDVGAHEPLEGPQVLITVSDTGDGMSPETLSHAFEPFFTTKEIGRGTGLGLSQVYGFVKQSGGHVTIDSRQGLGTTVSIYLPRLQQDAAEKSEAVGEPTADKVDNSSNAILVVEDDDAVRGFSTEVLRGLGYAVLEAPNAGAALNILDSRPDIRLLFTDVGLPGLMDGWRLSDEVRQRFPGLKVLVTTAYLRAASPRANRREEGITLIAKPFSIADLARKVRDLLVH
jgi:PAS domain S-box-containing protein